MYDDIRQGLEKISRDAAFLIGIPAMTHHGEVVGFLLPAPIHTVVPTCFIINAAGLLDEALKAFIQLNYTRVPKGVDSLGNRIKYLDQHNRLKNAKKLTEIKDRRNVYAHQIGQYGNWEELQHVLAEINRQLRHLGIL